MKLVVVHNVIMKEESQTLVVISDRRRGPRLIAVFKLPDWEDERVPCGTAGRVEDEAIFTTAVFGACALIIVSEL